MPVLPSSTSARLALCALAITVGALLAPGWVQTSSASFVRSTATDVTVTAAADWTPPTVSIDDPGTPIKGTVTISASASDGETGIAGVTVEYLPDNGSTWTALCTDTTSPYSCAWNTTTVADRGYALRARATDVSGLGSVSEPVSTLVANNPVVVLSNPGDVVRGTVPLTVTVHSGSLVTLSVRVEYAVAGSGTWRSLCTGLTAPHTCSWDTTTSAFTSGGEYDLRATAVSGLSTYTSAVIAAVLVDNTAPAVTMNDPGSPLSGTRLFASTASDAHSGIAQVVLQHARTGTTTWSDLCVVTDAPYSCSVNTIGALPDGSYSFRAIATDVAGNTTTSATVANRLVDNTVSSVSLNDPGAYLAGTVTLTSNASSTAGVTSVRIQRAPAGTTTWTDVCTDSTSPYTCSWNTTTAADDFYDLRAVLLDGSGKATTSTTVASRRVDNSPLRAAAVQSTNGGANSGRIEANDILTLTYSRAINPASVSTGWDGASLGVSLRLRDGAVLGLGINDDTVDVLRAGAAVNLGSVNLKQNHAKAGKTVIHDATMTLSAAVVDGVTQSVVTISVGTVASGGPGLRTAGAAAAMVWTPSGAATGTHGTSCSVTPFTEVGTLDKDF